MHYNGYRDGDDEDDKYFWPITGAHFEYSEVLRKLNKYRKRVKNRLSQEPNTKPQLIIKEELTKTTLDQDSKPKTDKSKEQCK